MRQGLTRDKSGVAAIEFAIVAPVFILLLLAILVFGMFFTVAQSVQQIAAEAARAAVAGLSDDEREALARDRAESEAGHYPLILADRMEVVAGAIAGDPDLFEVVITYDASHLGLDAFSRLFPVPADRIERVSVIRRGGW